MNLRSRAVGVLCFIALVAAIQVVEHLGRWYLHRADRVYLAVLREELVDVGAEMIEAELEIGHIRAVIEQVERDLSQPPMARGRVASGGDDREARLWHRNQRLNDINEAVARRNSAAARYTLLADSLRSAALRARDPYFAIPLPAEAAAQRGITADSPAAGKRPAAAVRTR